MFRKIFIATVGILIVFNGLGIILLLVNRQVPLFTPNRSVNLMFGIGFVVNYLLVGVCLFLIGIRTNAGSTKQ